MNILILSDGKKGHENQSIGVAMALHARYTVLPLERRGGLLSYLDAPAELIQQFIQGENLPDIIIATGTKTARALKHLKQIQPYIFTVALMRPSGVLGKPMNPKKWHRYFDVVALPAHDAERLTMPKDAIKLVGAPNKVQHKSLVEAKLRWQKQFDVLGKKKLAVLVGGSSSKYTFDEHKAKELATQVEAFAKHTDMALLITTAPRTGKAQENMLQSHFAHKQNVFFWNGEGENPILGFFACADAFVVTPESTSMVSEACSTGKPVYLFDMDETMKLKRMGKFNTFYRVLSEEKRIFPLCHGVLETEREPLNDAAAVAKFILERFKNA